MPGPAGPFGRLGVRFAVADATELVGYRAAFDTVIDSGMYHCLDDDGNSSEPCWVRLSVEIRGDTMVLR